MSAVAILVTSWPYTQSFIFACSSSWLDDMSRLSSLFSSFELDKASASWLQCLMETDMLNCWFLSSLISRGDTHNPSPLAWILISLQQVHEFERCDLPHHRWFIDVLCKQIDSVPISYSSVINLFICSLLGLMRILGLCYHQKIFPISLVARSGWWCKDSWMEQQIIRSKTSRSVLNSVWTSAIPAHVPHQQQQ